MSMIANWVSENTTTVGTGALLTLNGATSVDLLPFSKQFLTGNTVLFDIKDGNNREKCYGTLTAGVPWTLSRDTVFENWVAGVYTKSPATGMSLSGSAVITIDASCQNSISKQLLMPVAAGRYLQADSQLIMSDAGAGGGSALPTAGTITCTVCLFQTLRKITSVFSMIQTASALGNFRLGMARMNQDGTPGALIYDSGNISTGATGMVGIALLAPVFLPPGLYYTLDAVDNTVAVANGSQSDLHDMIFPTGFDVTGLLPQRYQLAQAFGPFPASLAAATIGTNTPSFGSYFQ